MDGEIKFSYETLWKFIIRPPRDDYNELMLGKKFFQYNSKQYERKDYEIMSTQGYILKCSFVEPTKAYRPSVKMPVVIYLHGNSSSRIEGLGYAKILLKRNINLFVFDFAGSGMSEGDYVSLGYHESHDLGNIIDFLEKIPGVGKIGIWGRSMGAATGMIYAHRDKRVRAVCLDSPFADFERLARELTKKNLSFSLPGFIISGMLSIVRGTILDKNGLDIDKLKPIDAAGKTKQPVIFIHAINDELIDVKHSMDLFNMYEGSEKSLKCCETGGHNSKRSSNINKEIGDFFEKYLIGNSNKEKVKMNTNKNNLNFDMNRNNMNNNMININNNMNCNFNFNNNNLNNMNNKMNKMNPIPEEEEIIINESQFSVNKEIKGINPKFMGDKNDLNNSKDEDGPFNEQNEMIYAKKREQMNNQRLSDMMTLFKSIKPDIKNSFKNNNFNNNLNNKNNFNNNTNNNFNNKNNNFNNTNNNFNNNINNNFNNNINNNFNNNTNNTNNKMNFNFNQTNNMNNNNNYNNNMNNFNMMKNNNNNFYNNFNNTNPNTFNNNKNNNNMNNNINNMNMNSMNNMNMNNINNMNMNNLNNKTMNSTKNFINNNINNINNNIMNNMNNNNNNYNNMNMNNMNNNMNNMNMNSMNNTNNMNMNSMNNMMNNMNINSMNNMNNSNMGFNNLRAGFRINNNNNINNN